MGAGFEFGDVAQLIYDPLVREDRRVLYAKHLPGIGLGLALAREMATALGGRIDLESSGGPGSTFTVLLPGEPAARASGELH
jgi:signal transduction histidine kinase